MTGSPGCHVRSAGCARTRLRTAPGALGGTQAGAVFWLHDNLGADQADRLHPSAPPVGLHRRLPRHDALPAATHCKGWRSGGCRLIWRQTAAAHHTLVGGAGDDEIVGASLVCAISRGHRFVLLAHFAGSDAAGCRKPLLAARERYPRLPLRLLRHRRATARGLAGSHADRRL